MKRPEFLKSLMMLFHGFRCIARGTTELLDATEFLAWAKVKRRMLLAEPRRPTASFIRDY